MSKVTKKILKSREWFYQGGGVKKADLVPSVGISSAVARMMLIRGVHTTLALAPAPAPEPNSLFVAVSYGGVGNNVMTSPDGIVWTSRTSAADNGWYSVIYRQ